MNKKALSFIVPIVVFVVIIVGTFITAIIIAKVNDAILTPVASQLGDINEEAGDSVTLIHTVFNRFWDWAIVMFFLVNIILLFLGAFLIDTHPIFAVMYMISCMFLMMFISDILNPIDRIYDSAEFLNQTTNLPLTDHLRANFEIILLAIMFLSGVIIYAKIRYFGATT